MGLVLPGQAMDQHNGLAGSERALLQRPDAQTGGLIGSRFTVVNTPANQSSDPDVAYDPYNDRFVVVWEEYQGTVNPSIGATVLYGSYQSSGVQHPDLAIVPVTPASEYAIDPAIAHNTEDHVFMIVFDALLSSGIKGRVAEIDPTKTGDLIVMAHHTREVDPEKAELGSTVEQVVLRSACPVASVNHPDKVAAL